MFGSQTSGANAYAKIGVETGVISASPHKLILMLFEGAIVAISNAQQHMQSGNIAAKGQSISKAISIIDSGLRASLDKKAGGEIAMSLDSLYEYMGNRLIFANLNNQIEALAEVQNLLRDIKSSWEAITPVVVQAPEPTRQPVDALSPRSVNYLEA
jgi:flagellar protein FliS